jgi:hypothetical protein
VVNDYDSIFQRRHGRKMKMNIYFVWLKIVSGRKENTREKSDNDFSCLVRVILLFILQNEKYVD